MLRPLTPEAPGTHQYRVVFAVWEAEDDRFVRRDVHELELWAADAKSARRQAQQDAQLIDGYLSAWRIREVARVAPARPKRPPRRPTKPRRPRERTTTVR
jgi:hypothetical protein